MGGCRNRILTSIGSSARGCRFFMLASPCHPWQDSAPSWLGITTKGRFEQGTTCPARASTAAVPAGLGAGRAGVKTRHREEDRISLETTNATARATPKQDQGRRSRRLARIRTSPRYARGSRSCSRLRHLGPPWTCGRRAPSFLGRAMAPVLTLPPTPNGGELPPFVSVAAAPSFVGYAPLPVTPGPTAFPGPRPCLPRPAGRPARPRGLENDPRRESSSEVLELGEIIPPSLAGGLQHMPSCWHQ